MYVVPAFAGTTPTMRQALPRSAIRAPDHVHQLGDLAPLVGLVAGRDRVLDAMRDMIAQHLFLDAAQRRARRPRSASPRRCSNDLPRPCVASPRIWPSIRLSRFKQDVLISSRIRRHIPPRVSKSRGRDTAGKSFVAQAEARPFARSITIHHGAAAHSCCGGKHDHDTTPAEAAFAIDPVCGMKVNPATAKHRFSYKGEDYLLLQRPLPRTLRGRAGEIPRARASRSRRRRPARSTPARCIRRCARSAPASCPICGMALEPEQVSLDDGPDPELIDMTRRFWIALALTLAGVRARDGQPSLGLDASGAAGHARTGSRSCWRHRWCCGPAAPFFVRGWQSLVTRNLNMFTLIAIGTGVAYLYSVVATLAPQLFPPAFRDMHGAVAVYFEAAAVITVLVLLGQVLELRARAQTSGAIRALLGLAPKTARRVTDRWRRGGRRSTRSRSAIACACVPARRSRSTASSSRAAPSIDESMVTGESMPVDEGRGRRA